MEVRSHGTALKSKAQTLKVACGVLRFWPQPSRASTVLLLTRPCLRPLTTSGCSTGPLHGHPHPFQSVFLFRPIIYLPPQSAHQVAGIPLAKQVVRPSLMPTAVAV